MITLLEHWRCITTDIPIHIFLWIITLSHLTKSLQISNKWKYPITEEAVYYITLHLALFLKLAKTHFSDVGQYVAKCVTYTPVSVTPQWGEGSDSGDSDRAKYHCPTLHCQKSLSGAKIPSQTPKCQRTYFLPSLSKSSEFTLDGEENAIRNPHPGKRFPVICPLVELIIPFLMKIFFHRPFTALCYMWLEMSSEWVVIHSIIYHSPQYHWHKL